MKIKIVLLSFILVGLTYTAFHIFLKDSKAAMSEKEAREMAAELYGGKVLAAAEENGDLQIQLENNKGVYQLVVDGESRKINTIELIKRKQELVAMDVVSDIAPNTGDQPTADQKPSTEEPAASEDATKGKAAAKANTASTATAISEQRAKDIAQHQAAGKTIGTEKITYKKSEHYKVSIDRPEEVVHVYVQANTGKVSSVSSILKETPDDDRDDDSDDDHDDDQDDDSDDDD